MPEAGGLPFVIENGGWLWIVLVALVTGVAMMVWRRRRRRAARRDVLAMVEQLRTGASAGPAGRDIELVRGRLEGSLRCVWVWGTRFDRPVRAVAYAGGDATIVSGEMRVDIAGPVAIGGGQVVTWREGELRAAPDATVAVPLAGAADWTERAPNWSSTGVRWSSVEVLDGGEVAARGRLVRSPGPDKAERWALEPFVDDPGAATDAGQALVRIAVERPSVACPPVPRRRLVAVFVGVAGLTTLLLAIAGQILIQDAHEGDGPLVDGDRLAIVSALPGSRGKALHRLESQVIDQPRTPTTIAQWRRLAELLDEKDPAIGIAWARQRYDLLEVLEPAAGKVGWHAQTMARRGDYALAADELERHPGAKIEPGGALEIAIIAHRWRQAAARAQAISKTCAFDLHRSDDQCEMFTCLAAWAGWRAGDPAAATRLRERATTPRGQICAALAADTLSGDARVAAIDAWTHAHWDPQGDPSLFTRIHRELLSALRAEAGAGPYDILVDRDPRVVPIVMDDRSVDLGPALPLLATLPAPPTDAPRAARLERDRAIAIVAAFAGDWPRAEAHARANVLEAGRPEAQDFAYTLETIRFRRGDKDVRTTRYMIDFEADAVALRRGSMADARALSRALGRPETMAWAKRMRAAARQALAGDGTGLGRLLEEPSHWQTSFYVLALAPYVRRGREAIENWIEWQCDLAAARDPSRLVDVLSTAAFMRDAWSLLGEPDRARPWAEVARRQAAALVDRQSLVARWYVERACGHGCL